MSDFSELHDELRSVAAEVLGARIGTTVPGELLAELGWTGMEVEDGLGGAGASFRETAVLCEQLGRAVAGGSFLGSAVLGVGLLNMLRPGELRDGLLTRIAEGTGTVAVTAGTEASDPGRIAFDGALLSGRVGLVLDAGAADTLLVPVLGPDDRAAVAVLAGDTAGLTVTARQVLDETRCLADVSVDAVRVADGALLSYREGAEAASIGDRALVAVACDSLGVAAAMLDATVDYVSMRQQFGRSIGSFQAVKHACADMAVQIAVSRQLVGAAVAAVADGDPSAHRAAIMAKAYAGEAAVAVAGKAMQLHGGIGYTWEADVHRYLKRATLNRALFGTPAQLRRELTRVGGPALHSPDPARL